MTDIIFLGTAGDDYVASKCLRNSGGIRIHLGDLQLHIDPGPNALCTCKSCQSNLRQTTAVICTSNKLIRCNDVNAVISAMTYHGEDINGVLVAVKSIIDGTSSEHPILLSSLKKCVEKIIIAQEGKKIGIENVDIQFVASSNSEETLGMKMLFPDVVIGYPSDTAYSDKIAREFENCDILILNVPLASGLKHGSMMSIDDAIKFTSIVKPQLVVLTGFGKSMLDNDPMVEARKVHQETGCEVLAATDGLVLSPSNYSTRSKQRSLKSF